MSNNTLCQSTFFLFRQLLLSKKKSQPMTKITLAIPSESDLNMLLLLLHRLQIPFVKHNDELAGELAPFEMTEDELDELDRRWDEYQADPSSAVDAKEAMKTIRASYGL